MILYEIYETLDSSLTLVMVNKMETSSTSGKVILNFGWKGPSTWRGGWAKGGLDVGVVDLVFKNAKTKISVDIPDNISTTTVRKLPFTCRRYQETELELNGRKFKPIAQETHPESLKVTVEQIQNLTIKVGIFEESPNQGPAVMDSSGKITREKHILRSDTKVNLEVPKELEIGQTYTLVITSHGISPIQAELIKEKQTEEMLEDEKKASKEEFQRRLGKMGEALISEGIGNLKLASQGGGGVFNSTSTNADIFAHGMQGVVRAGQQMHPEIRVPYTKPSESSSDLDLLTTEELQSRFEATYKKDRELGVLRMQAAFAGNITEMSRIIETEHANSQLLINLAEALERKGVKAQIPQSESFQSAANRHAEVHEEALKGLQDQCKTQ